MAKKKYEIPPLNIRAMFDPKTLNLSDRTVEVIFGTENPVRMSTWDGQFVEILSFEEGHVRWERINGGAPLLDNHNKWEGTKSVLGVVERAWSDSKQGKAVVRFSKREDVEPIFQDVKDGILKGISCGYRVNKYELLNPKREANDLPIYRAVDWEPFEISLAPIQADIESVIRSKGEENNEVQLIGFSENTENSNNSNSNNPIMNRQQMIGLLQKRGISVPEGTTDEEVGAMLERALLGPTPAPPAPAAPAAKPESSEDAVRAALSAEKTRTTGIMDAVRAAKLPDTFGRTMVDNDTPLDQARALIIAEWAKNDPNAGADGRQGAAVSADEADKRRSGMEEAILHRAMPGDKELATKVAGSEYRGMSLMRLAEEAVTSAGGKTRGLSPRELASAALNLDRSRAGMMSTSDFPIILGNTVSRRLLAEYALAPRTFQEWSRRETAADFKEMTRARLGEHSGFNKVLEGGEYKYGKMGEAKEAYKVEKFGEIIAITWETLVNDDLSAFNRLPSKIANAAARKQSDIVYSILSSNPNMSDAKALFSTDHGNLTGTGTAISIASLGVGRQALRVQKGIDAKDYLNLTPKFLLVGPSQETYALQYTSSAYVPNVQGQINPFKGLITIVEPRITGNEWYIIGDPNAADTIEYAFLEGEGELYTETKEGFDVDGMLVKARMVFGAKAIDWRNMYKNAGALPA